MARIRDAELERLKREISVLARVKAAGVELKRHGANWVGRCPFHDLGGCLADFPTERLMSSLTGLGSNLSTRSGG